MANFSRKVGQYELTCSTLKLESCVKFYIYSSLLATICCKFSVYAVVNFAIYIARYWLGMWASDWCAVLGSKEGLRSAWEERARGCSRLGIDWFSLSRASHSHIPIPCPASHTCHSNVSTHCDLCSYQIRSWWSQDLPLVRFTHCKLSWYNRAI